MEKVLKSVDNHFFVLNESTFLTKTHTRLYKPDDKLMGNKIFRQTILYDGARKNTWESRNLRWQIIKREIIYYQIILSPHKN